MKRSLVVAVMLSAFTLPAFAQRYTMFPDFAVGNGWITEIFFANQGLSAVPGIVVSFYDDNGAPVTINSNLGNSAALAVPTLNPGATQDVQITSASAPSGYAVIRYPSSGTTVTATEVFRYQPGGTVLADLAVPQQDGTNNYSFPVAINTSAGTYTNTGFAIANPTFDSNTPPVQTVVATLINSDGTIRQTITVPLPAGQHISKFVNELFPGLDNFIGSMSISSPLGVGVLADRQDGGDSAPSAAPRATV